jgi:excisionase family DNA binding protein
MYVTLGEAARQSGRSKSQVSRAIRDGKLSAERSPDTGSYKIEQSELQRWLDATKVVRAGIATSAATVAVGDLATLPERGALEAQIEGLKEVAALLRAQLADALAQRDRWQEAFQQQRITVAAPQPATPAPPPPQRRWWPWRRAG